MDTAKLPEIIAWLAIGAAGAWLLLRLWSRFVPLRRGRLRRAALFAVLVAATTVVIWVGDHNLFFMGVPFFAAGLLCFGGPRLGRLTATMIFFALTMSVDALLDTYLPVGARPESLAGYLLRMGLRPAAYGALWLLLRRRLPDAPPELAPRLWRLVAGLAAMPVCALVAVVLLAWRRYESPSAARLALTQGAVVLPFVLVTAVLLLLAVGVLAEHQRLEQAERLAGLREMYYEGLRRQEAPLRRLRHDLRNHLTVVRGQLARGDAAAAAAYLDALAGSPALQGGGRLCAHETANAVLAAKRAEMEQAGVRADFRVSLPERLPLADTDVCALLGNALDNALEGARRCRDPWVRVRCRAEQGLLMLQVENPAEGPLRPNLATTKPDRDAHGLGLPILREIAARYGGSVEAAAADGRFRLVACLPLAP